MPLSLADTDQRILQTIQSAEVDYLITALPELTFTNTNNSVAVIDYHGCGSATQWTEEISKPDLRTPCYVIHTSGTTGNVKNVVIPQEGIENLSHFFKSKLQMTRHDIVGWFADLGFDASIWEILMALMSGSKLMVLEDYVKFDHQELSQFIDIHSITTITLPPSCSKVVAKNMSALKRVIFAGTTLYASDIQAIPQSVHVYNAYGPTETTICATIWNRPPNYNDIIPIGTPLPNMGVIITNRFGNPLPLMLAGEICIFGRGIADGYLNNPTLTQKAFAVYETESGEKLPLYRTGDIGRFLPDGEIEYLGRADRQIKRYGYRVHLQEIENALSKIPEMSNVAVVSDGRRVACFYKSDQVCNLYTVKQIACQYLSWYMIPDIWTRLDTIPRMSNDKVNYTLLREKLLQSGSDSLSEVENRNGKEQP